MTELQTELKGAYPVSDDRVTEQWLTLKEASDITGKSINALTLLINRNKIDRVRKVKGKGGGKWLVHRDSLHLLMAENLLLCQSTGQDRVNTLSEETGYERVTPSIPLEHYEKKRDEWLTERDRLQTGLMMYRYKFEEMEHQMRLLPAPPEVVTSKLTELEEKAAALAQAQVILQQAQETQKQYEEAVAQLKLKLQEEEHAKEAFRIQWELAQAEIERPWWKKIFGIK